MKKYTILILSILFFAGASVFAAFGINKEGKDVKMNDKKVLIAYYSLSGNTKAVAEKIAKQTKGTLFEIVPSIPYPTDYNTVVEQAKQEKANDFRPELSSKIDVTPYDVIFVGSPVWWYTMAPPVKTFVSENKFDGKIIIPFCTHGGGGVSATFTDMQKLAPGAKVSEGISSFEKKATDAEVKDFLNKVKI